MNIRFVHFIVPAHMPYTDNQYHIADFGEFDLRTPCGICVSRSDRRAIRVFREAPREYVCCPMCATKQTKYFGKSVVSISAVKMRKAAESEREYQRHADHALFQ